MRIKHELCSNLKKRASNSYHITSNYTTAKEEPTAYAKLKVTGEPLIVAHMINGSDPTASLLALPPLLTLALPGKVTGTATLQVLPLAVETVAPVIVLPSAE
jgi:hypothetical protein